MPRKAGRKSKSIREEAVNAYRARETLSAAVLTGNVVSAADFKANCLALMEEVREHGVEFVITKHNQPVARLVPLLEQGLGKFIGRSAGVMTEQGDLVAPLAPDWDEGADL